VKSIRSSSLIPAAIATIAVMPISAQASLLPTDAVPNHGKSALLIGGALAAFYFARRRLVR